MYFPEQFLYHSICALHTVILYVVFVCNSPVSTVCTYTHVSAVGCFLNFNIWPSKMQYCIFSQYSKLCFYFKWMTNQFIILTYLTVRTIIWRFGLITGCGISWTIILRFSMYVLWVIVPVLNSSLPCDVFY